MLNRRYLYNSSAMADKLHELYRSEWATVQIPKVFKNCFVGAYKYWPNREDKDYLQRAITKLIRISDPNMQLCTLPADDTHFKNIRYQDIPHDIIRSKKARQLILSLTVPGIMARVIEYTKNNSDRSYPEHEWSSFIEKFATPTSEWYHDKFAKDLWAVAPRGWKSKHLTTKEEKLEMLDLFMRKYNRMPTVKDQWVVPKGHRLYVYFKQDFRILPSPGTVWRAFNKADKALALILPLIKKGKRPSNWDTFKYHYAKEATELEKQYPDVLVKKKWLRNNLTKIQQKKFDRWNEVLQLVKSRPELSTLEWWITLTKNQRYLVSNHAKYLDADFSNHGKKYKISEFISPIQAEIKKLRPDLHQWYVEKKKLKTLPMRLVAKNEKQQDALIQLAKKGKPRPTGSMSYVLTGFTRKNNNYPEFNKQIRSLRPDWFDSKLLRKKVWERFHKKKKRKVA